ncbi:STAS domain-containing protein [Tumidithrix helvetica PCC 7403]|uniref:STAS domain-containing protein n=1 Tax=Tumidithrix helvetica TaxID=3457545 RepID=UPI003CA88BE9
MGIRIEFMQPSGKLNATNAELFRQQASALLNTKPDALLIDMQDLVMMDSSGIGALVFVLKSTRLIGCRLALCSLNDQLRFVFATAALHVLFDIFESRDDFEACLLSV